MSLDIWIAYCLAVFLMMCTPGPSQLLMLGTSIRHGLSRSWATACGDLSANALQMLAAGFGVAALIQKHIWLLPWIQALGIAYLIWLGIRAVLKGKARTALEKPTHSTSKISLSALWFQGFFMSASNPKAVLFFAALFPQFLENGPNFVIGFAALSATYLFIDGSFLLLYGLLARRISQKLSAENTHLLDRLNGIFLLFAASLMIAKLLLA